VDLGIIVSSERYTTSRWCFNEMLTVRAYMLGDQQRHLLRRSSKVPNRISRDANMSGRR
jgi:hypothetical protein